MKGERINTEEVNAETVEDLVALLIPEIENKQQPVTVAIAGESGSGKTLIAYALTDFLKQKGYQIQVLQQDDYFKYPPKTNTRKRKENIDHVGIGEVKLQRLDTHLATLLCRTPHLKKPLVIYDENYITSETLETGELDGIIVEGTYVSLLKNIHYRVFIDRTYHNTAPDRTRRNREPQTEYLNRILQIEHAIISKHKKYADIIITKNYQVLKVAEPADQTPEN